MAVVKLPNEKVYTYWLPQWIKRLQKHRSQPPPRTALAAIVLSTLGSVMLLILLVELWYGIHPGVRGHRTTLLAVGLLTLIPGAYAWCNLYGAFRRWPGYRYDQIPSWDDESLVGWT